MLSPSCILDSKRKDHVQLPRASLVATLHSSFAYWVDNYHRASRQRSAVRLKASVTASAGKGVEGQRGSQRAKALILIPTCVFHPSNRSS